MDKPKDKQRRIKPQAAKTETMRMVMGAIKSWRVADGDYLEFGVFQGRAFIEAMRLASKHGFDEMRFFAFDSFEGLPDPNSQESGRFHAGQYACSEEQFLDNLRHDGADVSRVTTVPGFYDQSLTPELKSRLGLKKASVVWIDCDLYESTKPALDFVTDLVDNGTPIVFDDWWSFGGHPHKGEVRAAREWLEENPDIRLEYYRDFGRNMRVFIVQRW